MTVGVAGSVDAELLARIDAVPLLANRTDVIELDGGLTNKNLKVTTPEGVYVARLSSPESALLGVNRDHEHTNSVAAATSGAGPEVAGYMPDLHVLVVRFIDGTTWSAADVLRPANAPRLAEACRRLHAGPRFASDFNMLQLQPKYLSIVTERGLRLPDRYLEFSSHVAAIAKAMAAQPIATVPCNNDLLPAN